VLSLPVLRKVGLALACPICSLTEGEGARSDVRQQEEQLPDILITLTEEDMAINSNHHYQ
jgi:hypothetical protein